MGTKVPLITAAHVHNKKFGTADPRKPNSIGHRDKDHDALFPHHLSLRYQTASSSSSSHDIVAGVNGSSNGLYPSQAAVYGSVITAGPADKFGVTRIHSSPERHRRSLSLLNRVPEDGTMDYDHEEGSSRYVGGASFDGDEEEDEEEESELELEEELAAEGLYRGSCRRLLALYTLVPLTFIVVFTLLAVLPLIAWRTPSSSSFPYPPYFPFPLPEFLLSVALWSLSYLLRDPLDLCATSAFHSAPAAIPILLSTAFHSFLSLLIQQSAVPLLLIPHYMLADHPTCEDPAFRRVWWIALGWAAAEAVVGIRQGYEVIASYRDVLVSVPPPHADTGTGNGPQKPQTDDLRLPLDHSPGDSSLRPTPVVGNSAIDLLNRGFDDEVLGQGERLDEDGVADERQLLLPRQTRIGRQSELKMQLERDVDQLLILKGREELEEVYGMPFINIPVFISCLQRVNSVLFSIGVCLLVSSAYIRSTIAPPSQTQSVFTYTRSNTPLKITLPLVFLLQFTLSMLHTSLVLPQVGVPAVVYAGSLVSLGSFFAGLGVWEALS